MSPSSVLGDVDKHLPGHVDAHDPISPFGEGERDPPSTGSDLEDPPGRPRGELIP
jgi:hypothetical protein